MIERQFKAVNWWATPVLLLEQKNADELNKGLARIILQKEREILSESTATPVAGLDQGITAHWLNYNVLNWDFPEINELRGLVLGGFQKFIESVGMADDPGMEIVGISCWANILRPGECLTLHHHDPAFISAHYTVSTGYEEGSLASSKDSGHTVYYRPGFNDRSHGGKEYGVVSLWDKDWLMNRPPKPGNMIFFPSFIRHEVRPNFGVSERISIAMDFWIKKQEALMYYGGPRWFVPKKQSADVSPPAAVKAAETHGNG
jgi:uncharacterized protein (TIGR02466 family)